VMSLDNLILVGGRIATLDIYAMSMMVVAMALYLHRRPLLAGVALGIAGCMKEVALLLALVVVLLEAFLWVRAWWVGRQAALATQPSLEARDPLPSPSTPRGGWRALAWFLGAGALSLLALLWLLDVLVPGYDPVNHVTYAASPFTHLFHMYHYAQLLKSKPYEVGISSSPWLWLIDERTIPYAKVAVNSVSAGKIVASHATVYFRGAINPFIIFLAIPALFGALAAAWRKGDRVAAVGAAWCLGTFLPMLYEGTVEGRISYLYYMVIVMPGVYLITARFFTPRRVGWAVTLGWAVALVYGFLHLYPLRTLL
jgi:hypothetical protein